MSVESAGTLLEREEAQALAERVLERCGDRVAELVYAESDESLTRFAVNFIHQNVRSRTRRLILRLREGRRSGVASTARLDPEGLSQLVGRAAAMARLAPEDPDLADPPGPAPIPPLPAYDAATAECSPEERAERVAAVVQAARAESFLTAGALTTAARAFATANTNGVFAYHASTYAQFTCTVMAPDSSGWVDGHARRLGDLDTAEMGRRAVEKARRSAHPEALPAGRYDVILEENAVAELVAFLGWLGLGAQSYQEGQSFLNGRLGQRVTGERIDLVDDAFDPRSLGVPFDAEGVPRQRVPLLQKGVATGLVHDTTTARKDGARSTGHALPPPSPEGPLPYDLVLGTGEATLEEMIAATERGILVTRFWYNRVVDPRNTIITGMTRDGTFLVEKGRIVRGVRNLRFNESVLGVLERAERIGRVARPTVFDYTGNCVVAPALWVRDFHFTGVTEF
jgi:predicted Zn-dependent protease